MAKAMTLNAGLKWPDVEDDYVVRYEGHVVRRIRRGGERYGEGNNWEWSIDVPMAMPAWANGVAEGRDACMKEFTSAWGRLLKETSRARLDPGVGVGAGCRGPSPADLSGFCKRRQRRHC